MTMLEFFKTKSVKISIWIFLVTLGVMGIIALAAVL